MRTAGFLGVLGILGSLCGCGAVEPATKFSYGALGFSFSDTKNNDVQIKNFKRDPSSGVVSFDELTVRNNASDVMTANVAQMQKLNEQFIIHGQNLNNMLGQITSVLPTILPGARVSGPLGGSVEVNPAVIEAIIKAIDARKAASQPPAVQP